jgi:FMN-dependent NADH-azoreductase
MTTILHIDSSILGGYSVSRTLTSEIVAKQEALHPGAHVIRRDLVVDAAMHLSDAHMAVFQGGEVGNAALGQDLATGSAYIDDLFAADIIVIGAPMYNFTIPTQLKGWIDRVCVSRPHLPVWRQWPRRARQGQKGASWHRRAAASTPVTALLQVSIIRKPICAACSPSSA